eukprot:CAMPEP_0184728992 /NCGR_PEP_ID=MMETSP0314-20130426/42647_1 /TAXON_ID=38298 /ORGANISM="Rhodella maculata, Strain CCMP 736" /LENGTH=267 /DNA_ID=CAMNT_0027194951 /DNA_START=145 /DNA_END=945 /DNA_ORIENTATION=-
MPAFAVFLPAEAVSFKSALITPRYAPLQSSYSLFLTRRTLNPTKLTSTTPTLRSANLSPSMNALGRLWSVVEGNSIFSFSGAPTAEEAIGQAVYDMENKLAHARSLYGEIADERRRLESLRKAETELVYMWHGRAQKSLEMGKIDFAFVAILQKRVHSRMLDEIQNELDSLQAAVNNLKLKTIRLQKTIGEVQMVSRAHTAKFTTKVAAMHSAVEASHAECQEFKTSNKFENIEISPEMIAEAAVMSDTVMLKEFMALEVAPRRPSL